MNETVMVAHMNAVSGEGEAGEPAGGPMPTTDASIVPADSISGRALVAVIAIMTFLAALTLGAVVLVQAAAGEWQSAVAREITIQVRPAEGRDIEADVRRAADLAAAMPGIAGVRPYSKEESARLLEPWLGSGLSFDDLPVPRLIVVRIDRDATPDLAALRKALAERVPAASLDDHRGWIERMRVMASTAVAAGLGVLLLVLAATVLSVTFATRGAMATNRPIIEVLHFVGAKDAFIAVQFQRHFLLLGLKGGAIGGVAAMAIFALAGLVGDWFLATASQDQIAALFGSFAIGIWGYGAVIGLIGLVAVVTAATSRLTVYRTLRLME
jgi:cell division transport system permease protein